MVFLDLFSPFEWFFVILMGLITLGGIVFHLWIMLRGHGGKVDDDDDALENMPDLQANDASADDGNDGDDGDSD